MPKWGHVVMSQSRRAKFKIAEAEVYEPDTDAFLGLVRAFNANAPAWGGPQCLSQRGHPRIHERERGGGLACR